MDMRVREIFAKLAQPPTRKRRLTYAEMMKPAVPPPGVLPPSVKMAMDAWSNDMTTWATTSMVGSQTSAFEEGQAFLGYPELSILAQRGEYRTISETVATEMTRKWIRFTAIGDEDKTDRINELKDAFEALGVQNVFRKVAEHDGFFGRGHIFIDLGDDLDGKSDELKTSIGDGEDDASTGRVKHDRPVPALRALEAAWAYPPNYNSSNPLKGDWYTPTSWFVMATEVHATRFLTCISREVPDLLKPAYSFGGLSMSQMAKPYVDNWLRTRQSVSDIINSFSVFVLATNLAQLLQPGGDMDLFERAELFNNLRDNRNLLMLDKDIEDFKNVAAPLGTLDVLQAQAQEHMAAISHIPLVKLTGIQPQGLNADSEGVMRAFYDWIAAGQPVLFDDALKRITRFVQLSLWGEIDEDIIYVWEPLRELDKKEEAEVRKVEAETDGMLLDRGVVRPVEVRNKIAADEDSPYSSPHV